MMLQICITIELELVFSANNFDGQFLRSILNKIENSATPILAKFKFSPFLELAKVRISKIVKVKK